jgi:hypothetical protein
MAIAVTVDGVTANLGLLGVPDTTEREQIYQGTLTLSGNYGGASTHGDTLNFSGIPGLLTQSIPLRVDIYQQPASGTAPGNCTGTYCPGTTYANGVVSFANAGTELTEGSAYTGATASAVWKFRAWFPSGN